MINFDAMILKVGKWSILKVPQNISDKLPSRGQVMVKGTVQDYAIEQVFEPDGKGGHWLKLDEQLQKAINVTAGDTVKVNVQLSKDWHEPNKPHDFSKALEEAPEAVKKLWDDITPMARWEWIRWINATRELETRNRRIEASISKMHSGKRRPCCFNLASCTDPDLAKSGKLIEIK